MVPALSSKNSTKRYPIRSPVRLLGGHRYLVLCAMDNRHQAGIEQSFLLVVIVHQPQALALYPVGRSYCHRFRRTGSPRPRRGSMVNGFKIGVAHQRLAAQNVNQQIRWAALVSRRQPHSVAAKGRRIIGQPAPEFDDDLPVGAGLAVDSERLLYTNLTVRELQTDGDVAEICSVHVRVSDGYRQAQGNIIAGGGSVHRRPVKPGYAAILYAPH